MEAPLAEATRATSTMEYGALIAVAALALAVYDFVLNIGDEVAFIWPKSIRSGSILFIWVSSLYQIRYYGLLTITLRTLAVLASTPGVPGLRTAAVDPLVLLGASELAGFILMYSVQIVLQIRVHVMYQSTSLASFNALLFLAEIVVMQILWSGDQPFNNVCADISTPFPGARLPKDSCEPTYPLYFIPMIVFEVWIGTLAFAKFLRRIMRARPHGVQEVDIVGIFLQDSALHYVFTISGIVLFNLLGLLSGIRTNTALLDASFIVAGTRLILHLRRSFYGQQANESLPRSLETQRPKSRKLVKLPRIGTFTRLADESFWGDESDEQPHSPEPAISTARMYLSVR